MMLQPIQKCLKKIRKIFYDFEIELTFLPQNDKLALYVFLDKKLVDKITWPIRQLNEGNMFDTIEYVMNNHIINKLNIETEDWIEKYYPNRIKTLDRQLAQTGDS